MVIIQNIWTPLEMNIFLKEIKKFIGNKNIITNISIMCGYFCIEFIDFMLKGESLLDYKNLLSSNDYEKNDKIILKYFQ